MRTTVTTQAGQAAEAAGTGAMTGTVSVLTDPRQRLRGAFARAEAADHALVRRISATTDGAVRRVMEEGVVMPEESIPHGVRRAQKREALGLQKLERRRTHRRIGRADAPWAKDAGAKPKGRKTGRKAAA